MAHGSSKKVMSSHGEKRSLIFSNLNVIACFPSYA